MSDGHRGVNGREPGDDRQERARLDRELRLTRELLARMVPSLREDLASGQTERSAYDMVLRLISLGSPGLAAPIAALALVHLAMRDDG